MMQSARAGSTTNVTRLAAMEPTRSNRSVRRQDPETLLPQRQPCLQFFPIIVRRTASCSPFSRAISGAMLSPLNDETGRPIRMTPTTSLPRALSCCVDAVASAAERRWLSSPSWGHDHDWYVTSLIYDAWILSGLLAQAPARSTEAKTTKFMLRMLKPPLPPHQSPTQSFDCIEILQRQSLSSMSVIR